MKKYFYLLFIVYAWLGFLTASCDYLRPEDKRDPNWGRIVFKESIDGIKIGDTYKMLVAKKGVPTTGGILDGIGKLYFYYLNNPLEPTVGFHYMDSTDRYIRYPEFFVEDAPWGVVSLTATIYYNGKTAEGIGIGSKRSDVLKIWQEPNNVYTSKEPDEIVKQYDWYEIKPRYFWIANYENDILKSIILRVHHSPFN